MMDDLRHFRAKVYEVRENTENATRAGQVLSVVAVVMLTITAHTLHYRGVVALEEQRAHYELYIKQIRENSSAYARIASAAMNGDWVTWVDPHTNQYRGVKCDPHDLPTMELARGTH